MNNVINGNNTDPGDFDCASPFLKVFPLGRTRVYLMILVPWTVSCFLLIQTSVLNLVPDEDGRNWPYFNSVSFLFKFLLLFSGKS